VYVSLASNSSDAKDGTVGKTLAYTSIQFTNAKGEIAARGSHTKYVANTYPHDSSSKFRSLTGSYRYVALAWKHPENIVEELSPHPHRK
jgi:acyl-coenzyme A thioesterase 13